MPKTPRRSAPARRAKPKSLAASGMLYAQVFDQSPVPMWVVDAVTFKLLAVNDAAVCSLGYTRPELLDLTMPALCAPDALAVVLADPPGAVGDPHAHLGRLRRKDGGFIEVHMTWTPLTVQGKPAWLVLLTAPTGYALPAVDFQQASTMLARPLPELTAELIDTYRALQADLAQVLATEARLRSTLEAREVYLRTMQHQVKTTLQLATSLFNLQRAQSHDPHLTAPFVATGQRLQVLALLHEAMEQGSPAMWIDGAAYFRKLQAAVIRTTQVNSQRIVLTTDLDPVALPLAQAMPCGLILNELLTNAINHAFPEGRSGVVTIELHDMAEDMVMLRVTDTGTGVPAALDIHQPTRLGWQLVALLTQQLHGVLTLERNQGTRITVHWSRQHGPGIHRRK